MIIGKIKNNEKRIKFNLEIKCSNCKTEVPGGMQTSEQYYGSESFLKEIEKFKKNYLCGKCRDKKRIKQKNKKRN
ncbi:MAG: hypothetical protein OEM18_04910 [Nitrosopumilus sp.]|jgi:hypothetical protein|nr:hypothetical protein [Nitrosopumilus sp.]MDH3502125.1 hypothetical protein [Nitrosopumilus sp.]